MRAIVVLPTPRVPKEQVGMVKAVLRQGMRQRTYHVILPDQRRERFWAPFSRENLIAHAANCTSATRRAGTAGGEKAGKMESRERWNASAAGEMEGIQRRVASLTPALAISGCGCFLPDLTRFHCAANAGRPATTHRTTTDEPTVWLSANFPAGRRKRYCRGVCKPRATYLRQTP